MCKPVLIKNFNNNKICAELEKIDKNQDKVSMHKNIQIQRYYLGALDPCTMCPSSGR